MEDCNPSALHYERGARSLGRSSDSNGVSIKAGKSGIKTSGSSSRSGSSVSFNRCSSGRFSRSPSSLRATLSEEDYCVGEESARSSSGRLSTHSNCAHDHLASGYDDVFGGPPKYTIPKLRAFPSMYEEMFRMPKRVLPGSRLSDLPVFDPPGYRNGEARGGAKVHKGSVAAVSAGVRYEDIFGGLQMGPSHVGAEKMFGASESRCVGKHHKSSHRKSLNSFLQNKEESIDQAADQRIEERGSNIFSSSFNFTNDANMLLRPESSFDNTATQIPWNGGIQNNQKEVSVQQNLKDSGAAFKQPPSSALEKECDGVTPIVELPKVKLFRKNISRLAKDWLESNDMVWQRPSDSGYKSQKCSSKVEPIVPSPKPGEPLNYDWHFMSSISTKPKIPACKLDDDRFRVGHLKLATKPAENPPLVHTPPWPHRMPSSLMHRESETMLCHGNTDMSEQDIIFADGNDQPSPYEHSYKPESPLDLERHASDAAYIVAGEEPAINQVPYVSLHSEASEKSPTWYLKLGITPKLSKSEEDSNLAEVRRGIQECGSLDALVSSSCEETQSTSTSGPFEGTSDNLHQAEPVVSLAGTCKQREWTQGEVESSQKKNKEGAIERTTKVVYQAREEFKKENCRHDTKMTKETVSGWEKQREDREMGRMEFMLRENKTEEAKDLDSATHSRAAVEMDRKENRAAEERKPVVSWRSDSPNKLQEPDKQAVLDALERREREVREEKERGKLRRERELERQRERERERGKDRMEMERATKAARDKAVAEAQARQERQGAGVRDRGAMERTPPKVHVRATSERSNRAVVERMAAEARARAERAAMERARSETCGSSTRKNDIPERGHRVLFENFAAGREYSVRNNTAEVSHKTNIRTSSAPRNRCVMSDLGFGIGSADGEARSATGISSSLKMVASTIPMNGTRSSYSPDFPEVEGETEERRQARWERHQRTLERAAKALAEKNQRDLEAQQEQAEKQRVAGMVDIEIRIWSAGKQGNLRELLSTLHNVLWRDSGWQAVSLHDLISPAVVKKLYRKATLCVHPDKVQQKGASIQQKYTAEKIFDLLKEAWNKFNLEEQL